MYLKTLNAFILCLMLSSVASSQIDDFYKKLLSDQRASRNSYFVVVNVKSQHFNGPVVVTSGDLYRFLKNTRRLRKEQYEKVMKELLSKNYPLEINGAELSTDGHYIKFPRPNGSLFMPLNRDETVENVAAKGCEYFTRYYFTQFDDGYAFANAKGGSHEINAVISKLFEWRIATSIDDMSGLLYITASDYVCCEAKGKKHSTLTRTPAE